MCSVQFSRSVVSDSLQPHESQHARPPCPSPSPGVHSDSHPSSPWCHPAFSSSVVPFSSCPQSLPASEFFPMSQLFSWGGQSTGVSASASFLPKKSQGWSKHTKNHWIEHFKWVNLWYVNYSSKFLTLCLGCSTSSNACPDACHYPPLREEVKNMIRNGLKKNSH